MDACIAVDRATNKTGALAHTAVQSVNPSAKVCVRNLRKTYGAVVALDDTDLDIQEGEFLTLLGPSGSGKTTLLMMIAGLTSPDRGEIWIGGRHATNALPEKRDIGMVFQNYALFPHMTVYENIAFPLQMRKANKATIRQEVRRVLDIVQLPHVADRLPSQLSGGQQQRIALARCMIYRPSVILMDEPLGALDKKLREQMQLEIKRLHTELRITILYVTHDQEEALALSDRICLMNNARIAQIGSPRTLYFRPATLFAANFLGESNIFDCELADANSGQVELRGPNGTTLRAAMPRALDRTAKALKAIVRPESVELLQQGARADNEIEAVLTDVILTGQITRYYARQTDGQVIVAAVLTRSDSGIPLNGSRVRFGWPREATVLISDSEGGK